MTSEHHPADHTVTHTDPHEHGHHDHAAPAGMTRHCDVAVIGGSAAGLAGALQLSRQRRSVVVVDDGTPRNASAEHMHGYLGYEGAAPADLVAAGREEVRSYGGEVLTGRVLDVTRADDGRFCLALTGGHTLVARRVLVATGLTDVLPEIDGLTRHWGRGVLHCPFCHGYEVRDARLVQIITRPMGLHPTPLFAHLTDRLTVVLHEAAGLDESVLTDLAAAGVAIERARATRVVTGDDGEVAGVELNTGTVLPADAVVIGTGFHARVDALTGLGLACVPHPSGAGDVLEVDPRGQTAVPGVYAAGNVTDPGVQVLPSASHGATVGAIIAFDLAGADLRAAAGDHGAQERSSGRRADWEARYGGEQVWSGNPNGTLVAEVADLAPGRALDVGTGEGADALWLAEHGWAVTATDISDNALARVRAEADRRGLDMTLLRADANARAPYGAEAFDLVSLQYGSFARTPDERGLRSLLGAVAPGGTLLVVHHDLTTMRGPVDAGAGTRMYDADAFVGVDAVAAALTAEPDVWDVQVHETRPRPAGAASAHHVDDVVLRAVRRG